MANKITQEAKIRKEKGAKFIRRMFWAFALPGLLFQLIFGWLPIFASFVVAFQKYRILGNSPFVGLSNFYYMLLNNPVSYLAFRNTLYYAALSLLLTFVIPIFVAILLMEMKKSVVRIMMILWFIPVASMAGIIIWKYFYNVQYGLFNGILTWLGLPNLKWLNDPKLAMFCLVLPGLIMYGPGLIYIASLQSIPQELYEAAELEGASFWEKIWHITLPRLRPIIAMMLILAVINSLQVFDQPFIMTGGGPKMATYTVVMYIFDLVTKSARFGRATALGIVLSSFIMALIIIQRKYFKENLDI